MIRNRTIVFWLCVLLSFTGMSLFKIGLANFTLFHGFVLIAILFKIVVAFRTNTFNWSQPTDFIVAFIYIVAINLINLETIKTTSFIYSVIILCEFLLLYNIVKALSLKEIKHIIKTITILYFINIFISSLLIATRMYPSGILANIFQIYFFDNRIRPFGFSDEPSYASIVLVFSLYVFLKCDNFIYKRTELKWYLTSIIAIFLTDSSYGYMMLALLLFYFIIKNRGIKKLVTTLAQSRLFSRWEFPVAMGIGLVCLIMGINSLHLENNKSIKRFVEIYRSISTSDDEFVSTIKHIAYVDGSASMRVLPTVTMFADFKDETMGHILFGRGAGQSVDYFSGIYEGNITLLGFIPSFIYNYGLIGTFIFLWLFFSVFPKEKLMLGILFVLFIFNADFNTQIFLFVLFCIMASAQAERTMIKPEKQVE